MHSYALFYIVNYGFDLFIKTDSVFQGGFSFFSLDDTTGELLTDSTLFDRESLDRHELIVRVRDLGTPSNYMFEDITVIITDHNDGIPFFDQLNYK